MTCSVVWTFEPNTFHKTPLSQRYKTHDTSLPRTDRGRVRGSIARPSNPVSNETGDVSWAEAGTAGIKAFMEISMLIKLHLIKPAISKLC